MAKTTSRTKLLLLRLFPTHRIIPAIGSHRHHHGVDHLAVLHVVDLHAGDHGVAVRAVIILRRGAAHGLNAHAEIGALAGGRARRGGGRIGMARRGDRRGAGNIPAGLDRLR